MKQIFFPLVVVLLSGSAKQIEVPAVVMEAFSKQFADAKNIEWSEESENEFEAEYQMNGKEQASNFDSNGKWLITETEVEVSEVPAVVQKAIDREFVGFCHLRG